MNNVFWSTGLGFTVIFLQLVSCSNIGSARQEIKLGEDGGYTDLLIAIHDSVAEDLSLIQTLQVREILFNVTSKKLHSSLKVPSVGANGNHYIAAQVYNMLCKQVGRENIRKSNPLLFPKRT